MKLIIKVSKQLIVYFSNWDFGQLKFDASYYALFVLIQQELKCNI